MFMVQFHDVVDQKISLKKPLDHFQMQISTFLQRRFAAPATLFCWHRHTLDLNVNKSGQVAKLHWHSQYINIYIIEHRRIDWT